MNEASNASAAKQRRAAHKRFLALYRVLYDQLVEILFELDPIGVHAGDAEKFVPEATTILARLRERESRRTSNRSCSRSYGAGMDVAVKQTRIRTERLMRP